MENQFDVIVIGSGMGSLTTACLLAHAGKRVGVLEQNYLPGGCTSSYWRKGFIFESGATTLVGLDEGMPLRHLLDTLEIELSPIHLELPMQVHLKNGKTIHRYQNLEEWIVEAERVFGKKNQRPFWEFCLKISQFVWQTSLRQTAFPPARFSDLIYSAKNVTASQLKNAVYSFYSMEWLLKKYDLLENTDFVEFVDEQLLITAQNHHREVNVLFGATALCYTNYGNYYMPGGLINLVNPLIAYLEEKGSKVILREGAQSIDYQNNQYFIKAKNTNYQADYLVSGIPINNTLQIYQNGYSKNYDKKLLHSEVLNSAFQMGIAFREESPERFEAIHHQIHLEKPLAEVGSASIFLSLNHPQDATRSDEEGHMVASVSTHLPHPEKNTQIDKVKVEAHILEVLQEKGFLKKEDVVYKHSSTQKSWQKWTGREFGFVGGYPQLMRIKPWQMIEARLDGKKAYQCGDTTYPGQGIPGTVLSGIIAFEKMKKDWRL